MPNQMGVSVESSRIFHYWILWGKNCSIPWFSSAVRKREIGALKGSIRRKIGQDPSDCWRKTESDRKKILETLNYLLFYQYCWQSSSDAGFSSDTEARLCKQWQLESQYGKHGSDTWIDRRRAMAISSGPVGTRIGCPVWPNWGWESPGPSPAAVSSQKLNGFMLAKGVEYFYCGDAWIKVLWKLTSDSKLQYNVIRNAF